MRTVLRSSALLAVLALAGCEPVLFKAELDAPDVCLKGIAVTFPPTSVAALGSDPLSYTDLADALPDEVDLDIEVLELALTPAGGLASLDFVDRMAVRMQPLDPTASVAGVQLVELTSADHQSDGSMRRAPDAPIDISGFLSATDALFAFDVAGDLPEDTWQGEMDICVHTKASYTKDF